MSRYALTPDDCPACRLRKTQCICAAAPRFASTARFWLLTHPDELNWTSNTGQLLLRANAHAELFMWDRRQPPPRLLALLRDPAYQPWLVFPADRPELVPRQRAYQETAGKIPAFVLLDGTWKQARKMLRQAPWLASLPLLSLSLAQQSRYRLRRHRQAAHWCTAEVGCALLALSGNAPEAARLAAYFELFMARYRLT